MFKKGNLKRIIALGISLALLLTSMICASAEVNLTASATINDASIIFEPSTVTTGSLGWKENATDIENDIIAPSDYGAAENGAIKIRNADANQGWLPVYHYNADISTDALIINSGTNYVSSNKYVDISIKDDEKNKMTGSFTTAYKLDTSAYTGITAIKKLSGRLYSTNFDVNNPDTGIIVNYIDNGNFDYIYPCITSGALYLRTYPVRTETVTENGLSYKKFYGSNGDRIGQDRLGAFAAAQTTLGEETLYYIDFSIEYSAEGIAMTFTSGDVTVSGKLADNYFSASTQEFKNIINSSETKALASFGTNTLSTAKAVGFASRSDKEAYVDNVSVTFDYLKSAQVLADEFKDNNKDILAKVEVTSDDEEAVEAALAEYAELIAAAPAVADLLTSEKAKLDGFMVSFADNAAQAYLTKHATALALTTDTVSKDNIALVNAAKADYAALNDTVAAKVLASFNTANSTEYTTLDTFFTALGKVVYYDAKGNLVFDDMSGANADAWKQKEVSGKTLTVVKAKPNARILEAKYNFTIVPKNLSSGVSPIVLYADDTDYILPNFSYWDAWNSTFFNGGSISSGMNSQWYFGSHLRSPEGTSMSALATEDLTVTITYDYTDFDGEATTLHPNFSYAAKHINVKMETYYKTIDATVSTDMVAIAKGNADSPDIPDDIFDIGYYTNNDNIKLNSVEFAYAKSADEYSAEFEAFEDTYTIDAADVTLNNIDAINAAIAEYKKLDDTKKAVYKDNYDNLVALKAMADFHKEVANTLVTPASEAVVAGLSADYDALGTDNATVKAALDEVVSEFDSFRPDTHSATIKKVDNEEQQDLRFTAKFSTNDFVGNVVAYGMVMVPNLALGDEELVIGGSYDYNGETYKAVSGTHELEDGEEMPTEFYGYLSNSGATDNRCGTRMAARAFVIYEIDGEQYTLYGTGDDEKVDANDVTKGVRDGVAVRSVYSIARAMATDLIKSGKFNATEVITNETTVDDIAKGSGEEGFISGADIIKFTAANVENIENLANK